MKEISEITSETLDGVRLIPNEQDVCDIQAFIDGPGNFSTKKIFITLNLQNVHFFEWVLIFSKLIHPTSAAYFESSLFCARDFQLSRQKPTLLPKFL
jgi:hypothetical protein